MIASKLLLLTFALATVVWTAQARIGGLESSGNRRRRKLEHRKLQYAPDEFAIPDQYIVVFEDNDTEDQIDGLLRGWLRNALTGSRVKDQFRSALKAVVINRVSINVLRLILSSKRVKLVEEVSVKCFRRC